MTDLSPSPSDPSDVNFPGLLRAHRRGSSRLTLARLPSWLFGCCLLLTLGLLHILSTVSYTETMPFRGVLVGAEGQLNVASRRQGIVDSVRVTQGSYVEAGAVLLTLNTEVFDPSGRPLSARERDSLNARRQLLLQKSAVLQQQRQSKLQFLRQAIEQNEKRKALTAEAEALVLKQLSLSERQHQRLALLLEQGGLSAVQFEQQQANYLILLGRRNELAQQAGAIGLEIEQMTAQLQQSALEFEAAEQELSGQALEIERLESQLSADSIQALLAPRAGLISSQLPRVGQAVMAGEHVVTIEPDSPEMLAAVYVPGGSIGQLAVGQRVLLRYDTFDYRDYGSDEGRVTAIERAPLDPRKHFLPLNLPPGPVFRVTVAPAINHGERQTHFALAPGMTLTAEFATGKKTFMGYLLRPFFSLQGKLS